MRPGVMTIHLLSSLAFFYRVCVSVNPNFSDSDHSFEALGAAIKEPTASSFLARARASRETSLALQSKYKPSQSFLALLFKLRASGAFPRCELELALPSIDITQHMKAATRNRSGLTKYVTLPYESTRPTELVRSR